MDEKPILFSAEMMRAIISGKKRQTRRVVKPGSWNHVPKRNFGYEWTRGQAHSFSLPSPYGYAGQTLWCREAAYIAPVNFNDGVGCNCEDYEGKPRLVDWAATMDQYSVDIAEEYGVKKSPSIFMPKWACRLRLRIESVSLQLLNRISIADIVDEGIESGDRVEFINLWGSINSKKGYKFHENPLVWVVKFDVKPQG